MASSPHASNLLLARLPEGVRRQLEDAADRVQIAPRELLAEPLQPMRYAYFPTSCMLSAVVIMQDGTVLEAAGIGREGMVSTAVLLEEAINPYRIIQQVPGEALRVPAVTLKEILAQSPPVFYLLHRYTMTLLQQTGQNAACNLHHTLEERMSRWLLTAADRKGCDELEMTQELLSEMLGVRRQTVNLAARLLQQAGLITYRRGRLTILDRDELEQNACECYRINLHTYERIMGFSSV